MPHPLIQRPVAVGCSVIAFVLIAVATALADSDNRSVNIIQNNTTLSIEFNSRPALDYLFGGVKFKPCVIRWYTPAGVNILRNAPHDHPHHHAMMFAVAVEGVNFWEEHKVKKIGKEIGQKPHDLVSQVVDGKAEAGFSQALDWMGPDGELLLKERRSIELTMENNPDVSLVSWTSTLSAPPGKKSVELGGRNYYGLGMRFVESMDKVGTMLTADNKPSPSVPGHHTAATKWMAYSAPVEGKTVTVAIFDHPKNSRFPGSIFYMTKPFAYLSATIGLDRKPYTIQAAEPLTLKYGAALWDGEVGTDRIEAAYKKWLDKGRDK